MIIISYNSIINKSRYKNLSLLNYSEVTEVIFNNSIDSAKLLLTILAKEFKDDFDTGCIINRMINNHFEEHHNVVINSIFWVDEDNKAHVTLCDDEAQEMVDIKYINRWNLLDKMKQSKQIEIGKPEINFINRSSTLPMGIAIFDDNNNYKGAIFIAFNLSNLFQSVQSEGPMNNIAMAILGEDNKVIMESQNFYLESPLNQTVFNAINNQQNFSNGYIVKDIAKDLAFKVLFVDKDIISLSKFGNVFRYVDWFEIILLMALALLIVALRKQILNPLKRLKTAARKIINDEKYVEVDESQYNSDLLPIAQALNGYISLHFKITEANEKMEYLVTSIESSDDAKSLFIRNVRHVFRTPLHHILSSCNVIKSQYLGSVDKEYLEYIIGIEQAGNQLLHAIDNVIAIADYDSDTTRLNESLVDLNDLLKVSINAVTPKIKRKKLSFNLIIPDGIPKIVLDFDKMTLVMVNLLNNAIAYNKDKGAINLEVSRITSGIAIKLADSGIGIGDATLNYINNIFDKDESAIAISEKMGLGLNIVKNILNQHDIKFKIESQENFGTTIHLLIPNVRIQSI